jgi:hypothetical protein
MCFGLMLRQAFAKAMGAELTFDKNKKKRRRKMKLPPMKGGLF